MDTHKKHILIVEKSLTLGRCYEAYLAKEDVDISIVSTGQEAINFIQEETPDAVLLDLELEDVTSSQVISESKIQYNDCIYIVMTMQGNAETALEAMKAGANDYLEKPFSKDKLCNTLNNCLEQKETDLTSASMISDIEPLTLDDSNHFEGFIGASPAMQQVYSIIEAAAESKATVFITGESGTGKEVCAQAIHDKSLRKDKEFVPINCAAIPRDLMESEIFGHVKGAFTGAHATREGAAAAAHNGTLFLDELGEMDIDLQSKLLRFVQTGTFQKVGSSKLEKVDVRFVCATNRDPLTQVKRGEFREDLYYRLHVIPIALPPLRERDNDMIDIARNYLSRFAAEEEKELTRFSKETEAIFTDYDWPGNIRQLQNVVRNIVVLNDGYEVTPAMLPPPLDEQTTTQTELIASAETLALEEAATTIENTDNSSKRTNEAALNIIKKLIREKTDSLGPEHKIKALWTVEMEAIEDAISLCGDSITKAAKYLEVSPSTIYRKRQTWKDAGYITDQPATSELTH